MDEATFKLAAELQTIVRSLPRARKAKRERLISRAEVIIPQLEDWVEIQNATQDYVLNLDDLMPFGWHLS